MNHLRHLRREVSSEKDSIDTFDRQRLSNDKLGGGRNMSETSILFLHKELLPRVVVSAKIARDRRERAMWKVAQGVSKFG